MAVAYFNRSASLILFLTLAVLLNSQKPANKIPKDCASIAVALKADQKIYPTRNLSRQTLFRRSSKNHNGLPPVLKTKAIINLLNITLATSYLVLLSGDVSSNPGPMKDPCGNCAKSCRSNQRAVQCDECDVWHHAKCIGMGKEEYVDICKPTASWSCMKCLYPMTFCMDGQDITPPISTSGVTNIQPQVRLTRGLKIAHLNVNRLINKLDGVRELLYDYNLDVLALSETWLSPDIADSEIDLVGYKLVRKDRNGSNKLSGGGVMFYVRETIPFTMRADLSLSNEELLWIEIIRQKCKPLLVASIYRPPDQNEAAFIDSLQNGFANIDSERKSLILLGDFNIDQFGKNNSAKRLLRSFAILNDIKQIINEPTRITEHSKTLIDLIFVNIEHRIVQSGVIHTSLSDHSLVYCVMKGGIPKVPPRKIEYRSFKNYNKEAFVNDLNQVPWSVISGVESVDDKVLLWDRLFSEVADQHAPLKFKRVKGTKTPWMTPKLTEIKRDRDYHHKKARTSNSTYHWNMYKKLRNLSSREEKNLKSKYYCQLIEDAKDDGSKMWRAIKEVLPSKKGSAIFSVFEKGRLHTDKQSVAKIMNDYFVSIGKTLSKAFGRNAPVTPVINSLSTNFHLNNVSVEFVKDTLRSLKRNKAVGLDKLSARLLRDASDVISPVLTELVNKSFTDGVFPKIWKSAKVSALF